MESSETHPAPGLLLAVIGGPPLLVLGLLLPVFRRIQAVGMPAGPLEGIDMTPFARRDDIFFWASGLVLVLFVAALARRARTRASRGAVLLVGIVSAAGSLIMFLALTFAP